MEFGGTIMEKMASSSQLNQKCAQLLRAARKKQGLAQWEVAERLGVQQPLVAKIERGTRRLEVAEFVDVAQAIGVDPSRIIEKLTAESAASAPRR